MKNYKNTILLVAVLLVVSGCSLISTPQTNTSPENGSGVFSPKAEKGSLWKSGDGGKTFSAKSQIDEKTQITGANILSITFHPQKPMTVYVSTVESGIYKTENGGENWTAIDFPPKNIYSFILDRNNPDDRMLASGVVGDWGKIFRTTDGGENWEDVYTEPGQKTIVTALAQHLRNGNIIFAGTSAGTVMKSIDRGSTWKNVGNNIKDGTVTDFAFDAKKDQVAYLLLSGDKVYYSSDGGLNWINWEEEKNREVQALQRQASKVDSWKHPEQAKRLQKQIDALEKKNQENKMPDGIVSIAADPNISGTIYAGTNKGLFRSADYGKYWSELNIIESAKKFPINSIVINRQNSKEIVFVAGKAFYKSVDNGETWLVTGLNVDRPASFVVYDPFDSRYLFIGLKKLAQ